jgi:ABC-2 type transport system permease protein
MTSLRIFFVGGLTSYRALFGFLNPWIFIPSLLVAPIFQILLFAYIGRATKLQSDEFYVIGNGIQYAAIPCLFAMTQTIAGERYQQTLGFILVTPAPRLPLFVGRALPVIVNAFLVAAFSLLVGGALLGVSVPASSLGPLALVAAVSAFSCTGLGLLAAAIGLVVRETGVLSNILFGILLIFCGANVARDDLPGWMQAVGGGLPFTHGIAAARRLADGEALDDVAGLVLAEALIGAFYAAAGFLSLRLLEGVSRRYATLERA